MSCLTKFTPFFDNFLGHMQVKFSSFSNQLSQAIGNTSHVGNIDLESNVNDVNGHNIVSQDV